MPDGPEQEKRDAEMRRKAEVALQVQPKENVNKFNDKDFQCWLIGHDTVKEVSKLCLR